MSPSKQILLVDDEPEIRLGAALRLKAAGYGTMTAADGVEAVAAATEHRPDAVLMDVRMPRRDGLWALSELKRNEATRRIPVVMLSASARDQRLALDSGAKYFIPKPYSGVDLLAALESALADGGPSGESDDDVWPATREGGTP